MTPLAIKCIPSVRLTVYPTCFLVSNLEVAIIMMKFDAFTCIGLKTNGNGSDQITFATISLIKPSFEKPLYAQL